MNEKPKTKKLSVTVSEEVWDILSKTVARGELSEFVVEAILQHLQRVRQKRGLEAGFGAWSSENHPDLETSQDVSDYVSAIRVSDDSRLSQLSSADDE